MDTQEDLLHDIAIQSTFFERAIQDYAEGSSLNINIHELLLESPRNNKEQIKRISLVLKAAKRFNKLTADEIVERLPKEHKMTRAAFNAYLYGTLKAPPTREFMLALFKALDIPKESIDSGLEICWYKGSKGLKKDNFAKGLVCQIAGEKEKHLSEKSIEKISKRIYSIAELFINEESEENKLNEKTIVN